MAISLEDARARIRASKVRRNNMIVWLMHTTGMEAHEAAAAWDDMHKELKAKMRAEDPVGERERIRTFHEAMATVIEAGG